MEYNQDLTTAYVTVKVNGGVNVLRNIFHFNSEAIEDAFRNEFNDMERLMTMQTVLRCIDQTSCQSIHMDIAKLDSRLNLNSS